MATLNPVLFTTSECINNSESILLAMEKIKSDCNTIITEHEPNWYLNNESSLVYDIINRYNTGSEYPSEVMAIYNWMTL